MTKTEVVSETPTNWREIVFDQTDEETEDFLSKRPEWSREQQQDSLGLYHALWNCEDSYVAPVIQEALECLEQSLLLYGPEAVICSFNGGKDAVVVLHLLRAAHAHYFSASKQQARRPRVIYFQHEGEFPEVLSFLQDSVLRFDLDMLVFPIGTKYADGLKLLVEKSSIGSHRPPPLAFVLGTRSSDPNAGSQGFFAPSTLHKMPPFMRVNPILSWSYGHVWHFLRLFRLPYCSLYDEGYTSLGTIHNTRPCPALKVNDQAVSSSHPKYWPAYMLRDWDQERAGRQKSAGWVSNSPNGGRLPLSSVSNETSPSKIEGMQNHTASTAPNFVNEQRTVGLIIIGDEILKGQTADTNTHVAAKALRGKNVPLDRVVVVSDDQDEIVTEIGRMEKQVDVIITSGGVGPTHDDVTIKSVAEALGERLVLHEEMAKLLKAKMGNSDMELSEAQRKMATIPESSKLRYVGRQEDEWPLLQCRNIFVLPGIPSIFETKIGALSDYLSSQLERSTEYKVVLGVDEASIVSILNETVWKHPDVTVGSYPFVGHPSVKTVVTLEGNLIRDGGTTRNSRIALSADEFSKKRISKEQMDINVKAALDNLLASLPEDSVLRVENNCGSLFSQ